MKSSLTLAAITVFSSLVLFACDGGGSSNLVVTSSGSSSASAGAASTLKPLFVRNDRTFFSEGPVIGSPSSLTFQVYGLYISLNEDCTGLTEVGTYGAAGETKNFFDSTELFNQAATAGTYKCIAIAVSDNIRFKPNAAAVAAAPSVCENTNSEYTIDIYRTDSGEENPWVNENNADITPTGADGTLGDDRVVIYASTNPTAAINRGEAPININQIGELTTPLIVPGQTIFYADGTNQIVNNGPDCGLEGVAMGFR